jgi:hypothetical protein
VTLGEASAAAGEFNLVHTLAARELGTVSGSPLTADPLLGRLQENGGPTETMAPSSASPVIDQGSAFGLATDQRGLPRPFDFASIPNAADSSDIGAVELQPPGSEPSTLAFGPKTLVTLDLAVRRIPRRGPIKVRVANRNGFAVTGKLWGETTKKIAASRKRRVRLKAKAISVGDHSRKTVKLGLPKPLRKQLARKRRLTLRLIAKVRDPAGNTRTVRKRVTLRLKTQRRH